MRFLKSRNGRWHYVRRVPAHFAFLDPRGLIQVSLKTASSEVAKLRRDANERADDLYWQQLASGESFDGALAAYEASRARARVLGFEYKAAADLAGTASLEEISRRFAVMIKGGERDEVSLLGISEEPKLTVKKAMAFLISDIAVGDTKGMSEVQSRKWGEQKTYAAEMFSQIVEDKALLDVDRADAHKFHTWWMDRVMGKDGVKPISGNTANRVIGNMRKLFRDYTKHMHIEARNPFDGLSFPDRKSQQKERKPFATDYIAGSILKPGVHVSLNPEARAIMYVLIETGCRPSEICNLRPQDIHLKANAPYIAIRYQEARLIKTDSSVRDVPLIGIALEVLRKFPDGFPRYRNRETTLSATLMKHLRAQELLPSDAHSVYSFRHSIEKRMLEAGLDFEFRQRIMGHSIDRPEYGDGGSMAWRLEQFKKIELPFDRAILEEFA